MSYGNHSKSSEREMAKRLWPEGAFSLLWSQDDIFSYACLLQWFDVCVCTWSSRWIDTCMTVADKLISWLRVFTCTVLEPFAYLHLAQRAQWPHVFREATQWKQAVDQLCCAIIHVLWRICRSGPASFAARRCWIIPTSTSTFETLEIPNIPIGR